MTRNMITLSALTAIILALLATTSAQAETRRITFRENIMRSCEFIEVDDSTGLYKLVFESTQSCIDALKTAESHHWSPMADCTTYGGPGEMYLACTELLHPVWKQMYQKLPRGIYRTAAVVEHRSRSTFGWFGQCPQPTDGRSVTIFCASGNIW